MSESSNKNNLENPVTKGEFRVVMLAIFALLILTIAMVVVAVVLGVVFKSEIDDLEYEIAKIMPYLEARSTDMMTYATPPDGQ